MESFIYNIPTKIAFGTGQIKMLPEFLFYMYWYMTSVPDLRYGISRELFRNSDMVKIEGLLEKV